MTIDVAQLKAAAAGRWPEILAAVAGIPIQSLDGKWHDCPKCGAADVFHLVCRECGCCECLVCFRRPIGMTCSCDGDISDDR